MKFEKSHYNNSFDFEDIKLICELHLTIDGPREARTDIITIKMLQISLTPEKWTLLLVTVVVNTRVPCEYWTYIASLCIYLA